MKILTSKQEIVSFLRQEVVEDIKGWALVSAKSNKGYNTLTASWFMFGKIWEWASVSVYVKPARYTYEFINDSNYFTVSYFTNEYIKTLGLLGSKSGRDGDKIKESGLNVIEEENFISFEEASITFICEKIYYNDLDVANMPKDVVTHYYDNELPHRMYIGKIIEVRISD